MTYFLVTSILRINNSSGIFNNNILYRLVWTALFSHLHCRSLAMKAIFDLPDQLLLLHHELEWNALSLMQLMSRVWFATANATLLLIYISSWIALFFILHYRRENIPYDTFRLFSFHIFHTQPSITWERLSLLVFFGLDFTRRNLHMYFKAIEMHIT